MRLVKKLKNSKWNLETSEMTRIANEAVYKAKQENKKLGLPEFFIKNGELYFVLPSGKITNKVPAIMKRKKPLVIGRK